MSNASIGRSFEELLEWTHRSYEQHRRAIVEKNGVRARYISGAGGPGVLVADPDKSQPDFSGVIAPSGVAVHFDAKTTKSETRWGLGSKSRHQLIDMLRLSRFGALCFFLIESRPLSACFVLRVHDDIFSEDELPKLSFLSALTLEEIRARSNGRWEGPATLKGPGKITSIVFEQDRRLGQYDWLSAVAEVWMPHGAQPPAVKR